MMLRFVYSLHGEGSLTGGPCLVPGVEDLAMAAEVLRNALEAEARRGNNYWQDAGHFRDFEPSRAMDAEEMEPDELDLAINIALRQYIVRLFERQR